MGITSFAFLCFYAVILLVYYLVPKKVQWALLLAVSVLYFLTAGELWLILYPLSAILIVYWGALYVNRVKEPGKRKRVLSLVVVFCLLALVALKYSNFGVYTFNAAAMRLPFITGLLPEINFPVPLGISFYTLALLGYLFDVYYEIGKPQQNFWKFALYGFYFPVMISGPILRYRDVEEQLYEGHRLDYKQITYGFQRILWGFFKKLVIAERMAVIVNTVYGDYRNYPGMYLFVAAVCFVFQLYADFSGGMDIVIGISETFGIRIAENFRTPFFSKSIQEFWRRWHITLGEWLKDYLFYPLLRTRRFAVLQEKLKRKFGKKRGKKIAVFIAMLVLWSAVGMWHGGAWKYIVGSGLLQWCYIVCGEALVPLWKKMRAALGIEEGCRGFAILQQLRTFLLICASFVFFRAASFSDGCRIYYYLFSKWNPQILWDGSLLDLGLDAIEMLIAVMSLLCLLVVSILQRKEQVRDRIARKNIVMRWTLWYVLLFCVILWGYYGPGYNATDFIYQGF